MEANLDALEFVERLHVGAHWRVSHAWSSLPGWLVVSLRRHAVALHELTAEEAADIGRIAHTASVALEELVGCQKTYVMLFAEHPDFHLHFHVVPRMPWFTPDDLAGNVFRFVNVPEEEQVPLAERERLAGAIAAALIDV
jgi:diadenosine tetraphosphate (Ap4A) HIT family hydrolase